GAMDNWQKKPRPISPARAQPPVVPAAPGPACQEIRGIHRQQDIVKVQKFNGPLREPVAECSFERTCRGTMTSPSIEEDKYDVRHQHRSARIALSTRFVKAV